MVLVAVTGEGPHPKVYSCVLPPRKSTQRLVFHCHISFREGDVFLQISCSVLTVVTVLASKEILRYKLSYLFESRNWVVPLPSNSGK